MMSGACLCGANAFELDAAPGPVTACHCRQCRKYSGHFSASIDYDADRMRWVRTGHVARFVHDSGSARVFCGQCGSKLWFEYPGGGLSLEAGLMNAPTEARLAGHIFVGDKGGYYDIADGLPQKEGY